MVQAKNLEQRQNHNTAVEPLVGGAWTEATVRLAKLWPFDSRRHNEDGDRILDLLFIGGTIGTHVLYVDDVEIVEERAAE